VKISFADGGTFRFLAVSWGTPVAVAFEAMMDEEVATADGSVDSWMGGTILIKEMRESDQVSLRGGFSCWRRGIGALASSKWAGQNRNASAFRFTSACTVGLFLDPGEKGSFLDVKVVAVEYPTADNTGVKVEEGI
jgi:hypothetical protein